MTVVSVDTSRASVCAAVRAGHPPAALRHRAHRGHGDGDARQQGRRHVREQPARLRDDAAAARHGRLLRQAAPLPLLRPRHPAGRSGRTAGTLPYRYTPPYRYAALQVRRPTGTLPYRCSALQVCCPTGALPYRYAALQVGLVAL